MIIDFNKSNGGGGDLSNYYTSAQTDSHIQSAVTAAVTEIENELSDFVTSGDVETQITSAITAVESELSEAERVTSEALNELNDKIIEISGQTVDLSDYYTSAQTDSQIQNAVADFVTSGDVETQITSKGYATSGDVETQITSKGYTTSGQVETQIESKGYVTSGDVETQITSKGYATSGDIQTINERINTKDEVISIALNELHEQIENIDIPDVSNFVTSAQVETQITSKGYAVESAVTSAITAIENELSEAEQVTSTALVDINSRMVSSVDIRSIIKLTQTEYDNLSTKDNNVLYIIG